MVLSVPCRMGTALCFPHCCPSCCPSCCPLFYTVLTFPCRGAALCFPHFCPFLTTPCRMGQLYAPLILPLMLPLVLYRSGFSLPWGSAICLSYFVLFSHVVNCKIEVCSLSLLPKQVFSELFLELPRWQFSYFLWYQVPFF